MSEMEKANTNVPTAPQDDEEEFEIIQEDGNDDEVVRESGSVANDEGAVRVTYVEKSVAPSECTDVADIGDALDCGKSVCSEAPSSTAARLLESIYATSYTDNGHVDKLVEMLRGEYEQNRSVLENISKMVADLYKEKHDNAELRSELESWKQRGDAMEQTITDLHAKLSQKNEEVSQTKDDYDRILVKMDHMKLNQDEKESVICELQETFYGLAAENESAKAALAKAQQELEALRIREKEKDRKLTVLAEEMEKKCCELENKSAEGNDIKAAMEAMQKELLALKKESANHKEIIRILQEENAEAGRNLAEARKGFREKLDAIEQQWIRYHERNEVNFPDALWFVSAPFVR